MGGGLGRAVRRDENFGARLPNQGRAPIKNLPLIFVIRARMGSNLPTYLGTPRLLVFFNPPLANVR